ncbi:Tat pathway signal sequence domain protein [Novosphingobium sp.]|uniref:exo-rhamnogalacturonan lyase family protein n=1 Tax=Novosphingobium sp. TaxID=1874826 RepID=UPI00286D9044|nr:Tat pathway signal sequence domain protein [Novosphingobium sp.]
MKDHFILDRRRFLEGSALAGAALSAAPAAAAPERTGASEAGSVHWLDGKAPVRDEGQVWGQPWPRGTKMAKAWNLSGAAVQTWPLAWWPDGTVKWTGHALPAGALKARDGQVKPGAGAVSAILSLRETGDEIVVACAGVEWHIARSGTSLIRSASAEGCEVLSEVALVARAQDQPDDEGETPSSRQRLSGTVTKATVEQSGPVRAVVRLEGTHGDGVLPFSLRLCFHAGSQSVRIVHSLIFDFDPEKLFLRGLGLTGAVPMRDAMHDRHLRFGGPDGGLWGEAVRPLTGLRRNAGEPFRQAQIEGRAVPSLDTMAKPLRDRLGYIPAWGDFTLSQPNSDGFTITKRTKAGHGWIDVDTAGRAPGLGYVGGASGGVAFAMQEFWQRPPVRLDIRDAASDTARFALWHHAPDAPAMDLRFYHDGMGQDDWFRQNQGLDATYEDYEPGWGTAQGIARTFEFRLWALPATPSRDDLAAMARGVATPARLMATSAAVKQAGMFGVWNKPQGGDPLEARAKRELDFYLDQVEQRRWYGFWNYGDVMHSYDNDRHVWRYDIGGFAWDNSELSTDLWLWYSYLRTGRADLFRMAEAMCRHTGEVDVYHAGRFKGHGTRHGVQHWGDSSKQPRIANAAYRRIHYFLTADERSGDLMREGLGAEMLLPAIDIERKTGSVDAPGEPRTGWPEGKVEMAFGTVWGSLLAGWLAEWERTGNRKWRDRIVAGMESIAALPKQWFAGYALYDLKTSRFSSGDKVRISHLNGAFGVFEINAELLELVDLPAYREAWLDYCEFYNAPAAEFTAKTGAPWASRGLRQGHARFTAYAAAARRKPELAARARDELASQGDRPDRVAASQVRRIAGPAVLKPVDEIVGISTNDAAQWGLAFMQVSALLSQDKEL